MSDSTALVRDLAQEIFKIRARVFIERPHTVQCRCTADSINCEKEVGTAEGHENFENSQFKIIDFIEEKNILEKLTLPNTFLYKKPENICILNRIRALISDDVKISQIIPILAQEQEYFESIEIVVRFVLRMKQCFCGKCYREYCERCCSQLYDTVEFKDGKYFVEVGLDEKNLFQQNLAEENDNSWRSLSSIDNKIVKNQEDLTIIPDDLIKIEKNDISPRETTDGNSNVSTAVKWSSETENIGDYEKNSSEMSILSLISRFNTSLYIHFKKIRTQELLRHTQPALTTMFRKNDKVGIAYILLGKYKTAISWLTPELRVVGELCEDANLETTDKTDDLNFSLVKSPESECSPEYSPKKSSESTNSSDQKPKRVLSLNEKAFASIMKRKTEIEKFDSKRCCKKCLAFYEDRGDEIFFTDEKISTQNINEIATLRPKEYEILEKDRISVTSKKENTNSFFSTVFTFIKDNRPSSPKIEQKKENETACLPFDVQTSILTTFLLMGIKDKKTILSFLYHLADQSVFSVFVSTELCRLMKGVGCYTLRRAYLVRRICKMLKFFGKVEEMEKILDENSDIRKKYLSNELLASPKKKEINFKCENVTENDEISGKKSCKNSAENVLTNKSDIIFSGSNKNEAIRSGSAQNRKENFDFNLRKHEKAEINTEKKTSTNQKREILHIDSSNFIHSLEIYPNLFIKYENYPTVWVPFLFTITWSGDNSKNDTENEFTILHINLNKCQVKLKPRDTFYFWVIPAKERICFHLSVRNALGVVHNLTLFVKSLTLKTTENQGSNHDGDLRGLKESKAGPNESENSSNVTERDQNTQNFYKRLAQLSQNDQIDLSEPIHPAFEQKIIPLSCFETAGQSENDHSTRFNTVSLVDLNSLYRSHAINALIKFEFPRLGKRDRKILGQILCDGIEICDSDGEELTARAFLNSNGKNSENATKIFGENPKQSEYSNDLTAKESMRKLPSFSLKLPKPSYNEMLQAIDIGVLGLSDEIFKTLLLLCFK